MLRLRYFLPMLALAACSPLRGCAESYFELATDSRLPVWFAAPVATDRSKVTVKLTYWTNGDAEFELKNEWFTLRDVMGRSCWHPRTRYTQHADGTQSPPGGPEFVIVKVGDAVDVVEHKQQLTPVFSMSDDPGILREARESIARGECRHNP